MAEDKEISLFLQHFGVKGMHWGIRNDRPGGVSRHVEKEAQKDAKEFARAKLYYGQGAGTRRKLIRETVDAKKKRIPGYSKAFDQHLNSQDLSKHAAKAVSERNRTDRKDRTKKQAGYVARRFTGEMGTQAAFAAAAIGGAAYLRSPGGQARLRSTIRTVGSAANRIKQKRGAAHIADFLKTHGA